MTGCAPKSDLIIPGSHITALPTATAQAPAAAPSIAAGAAVGAGSSIVPNAASGALHSVPVKCRPSSSSVVTNLATGVGCDVAPPDAETDTAVTTGTSSSLIGGADGGDPMIMRAGFSMYL